MNLWGTRTTSSGSFPESKASGDIFRGSVRWDDPHRDCRRRLYASTTIGLILLASLLYLTWVRP